MSTIENSIIDLTRQLVSIPSRADRDEYLPVLDHVGRWCAQRGLELHEISAGGRRVATLVAVRGSEPSPPLLLNAPVDTVGIGNREAWDTDPFEPAVRNGWLIGRGTADCKTGVAILCHVLEEISRGTQPSRTLCAVFDADEHSGAFTGIRAALQHPLLAAGLMAAIVAYPGLDEIVVGGRGFHRSTVSVFGRSAHSGARRPARSNAVARAARLVNDLVAAAEPGPADHESPPPKVTVTGVRGGGEYSSVPARCEVDIDIRLTPSFTAEAARSLLGGLITELDADGNQAESELVVHESFPPFWTPPSRPVVSALLRSANDLLDRPPTPVVAGPSNVGNLLAPEVDVVAGFGVRCRNLHAANEAVELATIRPVFDVYRRTVRQLVNA